MSVLKSGLWMSAIVEHEAAAGSPAHAGVARSSVAVRGVKEWPSAPEAESEFVQYSLPGRAFASHAYLQAC